MIHYHGTPIGGSRDGVARFLVGRHALVPYPSPEDIGPVAEFCQSFVLDNGAFSVWTKGARLDVEGFTRWADEWHRHPGFDWALIPDEITGTEADNDALVRDWPHHLRSAGVPVWHLHESVERFVRLCDKWRTVAIGSSGQWKTPGTAAWWGRMSEAMSAVCDEQGRPRARLHGLRMLDPEIFTNLPFASVDSTNAGVNAGSLSRFGMYKPALKAQRAAVIADRIERFNSAAVWLSRPVQVDMILTTDEVNA